MARWSPDVELDEQRVLDVVDDQFPELAVRQLGVRHVASGWDNAVWRSGPMALRFVQRAVAVPLFERERDLLGRLAPLLPVPIPTLVHVGRATSDVPFPWFAYRFLDGDEVATRALSTDARARLGEQLGSFLRVLHSPAVLKAVDPERALPVDPGRRADMTSVAARLDEGVAHAAAAGFELDVRDVARIAEIRAAADVARPQRELVFVHGDLHVRHVLVDDAGRATGIIDWGDACRAPALLDHVLYWSLLDDAGRSRYRAAYGPIDDASLDCSRLLALMLAAMIVGSAGDVGRPDVARGAFGALRRILRD